MLWQLVHLMVEGFTAPQRSVRRMLDAQHGVDVAVLLLVLGYVIQAIFAVIFAGQTFGAEGGGGIGAHIFGLFTQAGLVVLIAVLAQGIGKAAGGSATPTESFVAIAWHSVVTTLLTPVFLIGASLGTEDEISALGLVLVFAAGGIWLWLLASFITELHRFQSAGKTFAVMMGVFMLISMVLTLIVSPQVT